MGIREDIRGALGAIAAAIPEAAATMRHGDGENGAVVQSSSRDFAEPLSTDAPVEVARFAANAADFPSLDTGAAVEIGKDFHVVTSVKRDPVGATLFFGVSDTFSKVAAVCSGTRRANGQTRQFHATLDILILENGVADNHADALAPTYATSYTVAIRREDWPELSSPEPSDALEVAAAQTFALKVSTVARHDGWFVLNCRTRG